MMSKSPSNHSWTALMVEGVSYSPALATEGDWNCCVPHKWSSLGFSRSGEFKPQYLPSHTCLL